MKGVTRMMIGSCPHSAVYIFFVDAHEHKNMIIL